MKIFFDTSAFVKRYIEEPGSEDVLNLCRQADDLLLSIICLPEMISALSRLVREGSISEDAYRQIKDLIAADLNDVEICNLTPDIIQLAIKCLENNSLRAMDALHLACALSLQPDLFISSDRRQIGAAQKEGLTTREV